MKNLRPDLPELIHKTQAFYESDRQGAALIKVKSIKTIPAAGERLTDYRFPDEYPKYLDDCYRHKLAVWQRRAELRDDHIPAMGPWYGIAEHSAFLGGKVDYGKNTSWHHEMLENPSEIFKLSMDEKNPIYQMVVGGIEYIRERYGDTFVPMVRGTSGVLEIANTLCGNEFFYDFYEEPEALHELLQYCENAIIWYYEKQLDAAGDCMGGVVTGFGEWLPGHAIGHMSEDTTTMISQELFEEFGRAHTQNLLKHFGCGFIHTHALSERCLPSIASLDGLKLMELSSDPNTDRAIEVYKRNRPSLTRPIPVLNLTREEIKSNVGLLKAQKTILWYDASCMEDAQDMCQWVRRELPAE